MICVRPGQYHLSCVWSLGAWSRLAHQIHVQVVHPTLKRDDFETEIIVLGGYGMDPHQAFMIRNRIRVLRIRVRIGIQVHILNQSQYVQTPKMVRKRASRSFSEMDPLSNIGYLVIQMENCSFCRSLWFVIEKSFKSRFGFGPGRKIDPQYHKSKHTLTTFLWALARPLIFFYGSAIKIRRSKS